MATAEDMVKYAKTQVGYRESPAGSNKTKYGAWYDGGKFQGQPWCAIFVSFVANAIGEEDAVGHFAYCPYWVDHFKKRGEWLDRSEKPRPGDIIFFSNGKRACHVGIVEERMGTDYVLTIEGNTSRTSNDNGGAVMRRQRAYGERGSSWFIMGFGRPKYSGNKAGWQKDSKGWWYRNADGTYPKSKWEKIGGYWFHFDDKGYMQTGWLKDGGKWYYLKPDAPHSGRMLTGWQNVGGAWYYLDSDGHMLESCFRQISGKWYGFQSNGKMVEDSSALSVSTSGSISIK